MGDDAALGDEAGFGVVAAAAAFAPCGAAPLYGSVLAPARGTNAFGGSALTVLGTFGAGATGGGCCCVAASPGSSTSGGGADEPATASALVTLMR